ncbi:hypothetical protein LVD17_00545 [Fulvivirga ulvae]|uniref:ligand-binding sensor domain-containing protein n=1 Tax=Fulvivirga ulvae TaxID=2904245 RepID=UPI001F275BAF|nr:two-component regulator propeller domain-containing protein [Fulvivirga ulvae]UII32326.1 hypothetical protein LVD17_00545 [Fulvivirga ulvae]
MKTLTLMYFPVLILALVIFSCSEQSKNHLAEQNDAAPKIVQANLQDDYSIARHLGWKPEKTNKNLQVGEYVRKIFQDTKGHLWFGTNSQGVAHYDGDSLTYLSAEEGLSGMPITGIMEDKAGNMWFTTHRGVSMYDGASFRNFTVKDGLADDETWSIFQDSKGMIWVGTARGLCRFNGEKFEVFSLPSSGMSWVWSIAEDRMGNLWFGTNGEGVYKYDGETVTNINKQNGLSDNSIVSILEDAKGNIWFSSMHGGVSRYDGGSFARFFENEIGSDEVWALYEDKAGNIWFSSEGFGVYRYDGANLANFGQKDGLNIKVVQAIFEDKAGQLWVGGAGGLYRLERKTFVNITRDILNRDKC